MRHFVDIFRIENRTGIEKEFWKGVLERILYSKWAFGPRDKRAQTATQIRKNKVKDYLHDLQVFQNDLRYVGPFIFDASSHEEVGKILADLPF